MQVLAHTISFNWRNRLNVYLINNAKGVSWYTLIGLSFGLIGSAVFATFQHELYDTGAFNVEEGNMYPLGCLVCLVFVIFFMLDLVLLQCPRLLPLTCIMLGTFIVVMWTGIIFGTQFTFGAYVISAFVFVFVGPIMSTGVRQVWMWEIYVIIHNLLWVFVFCLLSAPVARFTSIFVLIVVTFTRGRPLPVGGVHLVNCNVVTQLSTMQSGC